MTSEAIVRNINKSKADNTMTSTMELEWQAFDEMKKTFNPVPATIKPIKKNEFECDCGGQQVISDSGLPVCTTCGVVVSMFIDDKAEWVNGPSDGGATVDKSRCGPSKDLALFSEQWGNSTMGFAQRGASYAQRRLARIAFHQSMNHRDRALFHAYKGMEEAGEHLGLGGTAVIRNAKIMYRKFNSEKLTRGAIRTGIKANCVIYSCKIEQMPRSTKEVSAAFGVPTKDVSRTTDMFRSVMLAETIASDNQTTNGITKPTDVISRLLNNFEIENARKFRVKCIKFADHIEKCVELMGKTPNSIASVIIYKLMDGQVTKQEIASKCNVSLPTINKIDTIINKYLENSV